MKVILIGAPRSGTNMLRDVLASLEGVVTWPCDEINYIWRYGNRHYPSDELGVENVTLEIARYVNSCFDFISYKYGGKVVVEKTCANSLRVPFVDSILPDSKFIFIYRDGIDVVSSARGRWRARLDIPYLLKKIRFVPKWDIPYYGFRFFLAHIYRLFSSEGRVAFWGPALNNMQALLQKHTLNEVCALQWQQCIAKAEQAFAVMPPEKVVRVRYEDFVRNPLEELSRIIKFIELDIEPDRLAQAVEGVSSDSVGKGRKVLDREDVEKLEALVGGTLRRYGYL